MTWNVKIAAAKAADPENACPTCKHGQYPAAGPVPCNVMRIAPTIGYALTSIDVGADGHMVPGTAVLNCYGYEPKAEPVAVDLNA